MDRREILKYAAAGTVATVAGIAVRPALGDPQAERPGENHALAGEEPGKTQHGQTQIERIEAITSFIPGEAPAKREPGQFPGTPGCPPVNHQVIRDEGMVMERDIVVKMRDGAEIYVDLYRPEGQDKVPVIIGWSPYGKFKHIEGKDTYDWFKIKYSPGQVSKYNIAEFLDPVRWCHRGYALVVPDPRGHWYSHGDGYMFGGPQESQDYYDLIEWAGTQQWSTGKVGIAGVSYWALSQYGVAALRPPHLAAMMPWEGFSDPYREMFFQGGIPENALSVALQENNLASTTRVEDLSAMAQTNLLFDEYWASKVADLAQIEVPAYVVVGWAEQGFHLRGGIEAFRRMSSKQKWLEAHGQQMWDYFLQDKSIERQMQFFDYFLKGMKNEVPTWPKVRLEVRDKYYVGNFRSGKEFPLERTDYRKLYLNAASASLGTASVSGEAQAKYEATNDNERAQFDFVFPETTELTGYMNLRLWVSSIGSDDMDLFVGIEKYDRDGGRVQFPYGSIMKDGSVALGWLRVSHRELDMKHSTPEHPIQSHRRELRLAEGVPVPVEIEIWPSSTRFFAGEKLRVVVQGSDIHKYPLGKGSTPLLTALAVHHPRQRHSSTRNKGQHVIHTGGQYDSYLLIPVIPAALPAES